MRCTDRIYPDTCILIKAWRATKADEQSKAIDVILNCQGVYSHILRIEAIFKAVVHQNHEEVGFYEAFFDLSEKVAMDDSLLKEAEAVACTHDIACIDAIHVAAATKGRAVLVTDEGRKKPLHRTDGVAYLADIDEVE